MPAVNDEARLIVHKLEAPRPAHGVQSVLHIALVERPAAAAQYLHELQYDSGVAQLVCPQQRQRVDLAATGEALTEETVKLAVQLREIRDVQPCAYLVAALAHDLRHAL